jgi:hypothetical protein
LIFGDTGTAVSDPRIRAANPCQPPGDPRRLLAACDLIETPSRMALFRMRSGDRSIAFAICSIAFFDLANSSKRRSSLKDQDFRTIAKKASSSEKLQGEYPKQ